MERKRSILIVDDEVDISMMEKLILDETGLYEVHVCNRGSEALEMIREKRPDLLLLDIVMPDADGTDLAARIREDKSLSSMKVAFMTSLVSSEEMAKNSLIGGYPFISKPVTGEMLLRRVREILEIGN